MIRFNAWCRGVLAWPALFGCGDPLSHVESIDKTRVLAAKVEVAGDPTRAAPLPGEDVRVRWLVVAPEPEPAVAFAFAACVAQESPSAFVDCAGEPFATAESLDPVTDAPAIDFFAPADATGDERLAVLGAVCPAGSALLDASGLACSDGSNAQAVSFDFAMDDGNHPNTNPAFASVTFDGDELVAETGDSTDCATLPSVAAGAVEHGIRVALADGARDPLERLNGADPAQESLLISYFVTHGELDHAWSAIESTAPAANGAVTWTGPARVDAPLLSRFIFVVRDGRGGSDFTERRVCIVP